MNHRENARSRIERTVPMIHISTVGLMVEKANILFNEISINWPASDIYCIRCKRSFLGVDSNGWARRSRSRRSWLTRRNRSRWSWLGLT